ncbi:MAG: hypothetical protein MUF54_02445 [Polyangiaceae bacterium]|nr:hypothetical protein [Polyangiaceae bacterium]
MERDRGVERPQLVFRGAVLGPTEPTRVRHVIESLPRQTRQDIARATCRVFGWRCDSGAWAVRATRELRVRLDQAQLVRLPAACRLKGDRRAMRWKVFDALAGLGQKLGDEEIVPRAPRPNARLTNAQIAGARGIALPEGERELLLEGLEELAHGISESACLSMSTRTSRIARLRDSKMR